MYRRMLIFFVSFGIMLWMGLETRAAENGSILLTMRGGTAALYRVGDLNGQSLILREEYGSVPVSQEEILSPELAQRLQERGGSGLIKAADVRGEVLFSGLESGLYLVTQPSTPSGQEPFAPFLVCLPWDGGQWNVEVNLQSIPQTGDYVDPGMWWVAMTASVLGIACCVVWSTYRPVRKKSESK